MLARPSFPCAREGGNEGKKRPAPSLIPPRAWRVASPVRPPILRPRPHNPWPIASFDESSAHTGISW